MDPISDITNSTQSYSAPDLPDVNQTPTIDTQAFDAPTQDFTQDNPFFPPDDGGVFDVLPDPKDFFPDFGPMPLPDPGEFPLPDPNDILPFPTPFPLPDPGEFPLPDPDDFFPGGFVPLTNPAEGLSEGIRESFPVATVENPQFVNDPWFAPTEEMVKGLFKSDPVATLEEMAQRGAMETLQQGLQNHLDGLKGEAWKLKFTADANQPLLDSLTSQIKYNYDNPRLTDANRAALLNQHKQVKQIVEGAEESLRGVEDRIKIHSQIGNTVLAGLSAGSAVKGLVDAEAKIDQQVAAGDHRGAWRTTLGAAGRFFGDFLGAIPNKLSFGASMAVGTALSEGGEAIGERAADGTFDTINEGVHWLCNQSWWPQSIRPAVPLKK